MRDSALALGQVSVICLLTRTAVRARTWSLKAPAIVRPTLPKTREEATAALAAPHRVERSMIASPAACRACVPRTPQDIEIYTDYKLDESYTPQHISVRAGTTFHDIQEVYSMELEEPTGWVKIPLGDVSAESKCAAGRDARAAPDPATCTSGTGVRAPRRRFTPATRARTVSRQGLSTHVLHPARNHLLPPERSRHSHPADTGIQPCGVRAPSRPMTGYGSPRTCGQRPKPGYGYGPVHTLRIAARVRARVCVCARDRRVFWPGLRARGQGSEQRSLTATTVPVARACAGP